MLKATEERMQNDGATPWQGGGKLYIHKHTNTPYPNHKVSIRSFYHGCNEERGIEVYSKPK